MTKNDMVIEIAKKTNVEQQKVKRIVQMTLDGLIDVLVSEGRIELRNFGVFEVRQRKARKARNPRTGVAVMVQAKCAVSFKAGKVMEERVGALTEIPTPKETPVFEAPVTSEAAPVPAPDQAPATSEQPTNQ